MNDAELLELAEPQVLTVQRENIITLPLGLLGFEQIKKYVLLNDPEQTPFMWLQVLDDPDRAFLVVSPFVLLPDYKPEISDEDVKFLGLAQPEDALIINIVTLLANGRATMNLKGPIILNRHTLRGKQVILTNAANFQLKFPLPLAEA
jgi:flagellar assembly factor FliW